MIRATPPGALVSLSTRRLILRLHDAGDPSGVIADDLEQRGVPHPDGRPWLPADVEDVLALAHQ